jgi:hypothetical protein
VRQPTRIMLLLARLLRQLAELGSLIAGGHGLEGPSSLGEEVQELPSAVIGELVELGTGLAGASIDVLLATIPAIRKAIGTVVRAMRVEVVLAADFRSKARKIPKVHQGTHLALVGVVLQQNLTVVRRITIVMAVNRGEGAISVLESNARTSGHCFLVFPLILL